MSNIKIFLFIIFISLILIFLLSFFAKPYKRLTGKKNIFTPFTPPVKEKLLNPDINTDNWDLHKKRLKKFRRSQYKGLTFFVSSEDRIYYLSEKGNKVYC